MKIISILAVAGLITVAGMTKADAQPAAPPMRATPTAADPPGGAFFIGLGGSYNSLNFGTQNAFMMGNSLVFQNGAFASNGSAGGPANISMNSESNLGLAVQGGYFRSLAGSDWLWGAKFAYGYFGTTSTVRNALIPQSGSFTPIGGSAPLPFTGNVVVSSYQVSIIQQVAFIPFIGRSFDRGFVYLGAGPTLSQIRTRLNGVIGFADITGTPANVSGAPVDFASASWVLGGAATVGVTYFFDRSLFVDVSYTAGITRNQAGNYSGPFLNPNGAEGTTTLGLLTGSSSGRVITQAVTVTLNKAF